MNNYPPDPPFSYTEWNSGELRATARLLHHEKDTGEIPRQVQRADRELLHVAFELWAREHVDAPRDALEDMGTEGVRTSDPATA